MNNKMKLADMMPIIIVGISILVLFAFKIIILTNLKLAILTSPIIKLSIDNNVNGVVNLITDLDKGNPQHSLNFYTQNLDALQAVENKLNIENRKNNLLIHLSKIGNGLDGIHVSIKNILPDDPWRITYKKREIKEDLINTQKKFYNKNIIIDHIYNNISEVTLSDSTEHRFQNTLNADIVENN